jgi:hypothetical protein
MCARASRKKQPLQLVLAAEPFPCQERVDVPSHKSPCVRFDPNDYSIPHTHVRRTLQVVANQECVRVLDCNDVIATHARSFDRDQQTEDPRHVEALIAQKRAGRAYRAWIPCIMRLPVRGRSSSWLLSAARI